MKLNINSVLVYLLFITLPFCFSMLVACGGSGKVPPETPGNPCANHVFEDISIPMRDAKSLTAFVRRPVNPGCQLPTILIQTPYDKENARSLFFEDDMAVNPLFDSTDYTFVVLDWRGYNGSRDAAVLNPNYGQDGYDAVEWIAAQSWSNGKVGTWGVSALCRVQHWTAVEQPPHLVAAVPIFCAMNHSYEQYYPGGVLRREYVDVISFLFGADSLEAHPFYDATWLYAEGLYDPADVQVPMLLVAGWYDLDPVSNLRTFDALYNNDNRHRLLIGPWIHFAVGGDSAVSALPPLDEQELKYVDVDKRIQSDSLAWFNFHLRNFSNEVTDWNVARYAIDGEASWTDANQWPPSSSVDTSFFLGADGSLSEMTLVAGTINYPFDPMDPSKTEGGQTLRTDLKHGPRDQAPVIAHAEAVTFSSSTLTTPLRIAGRVRVTLAVSTTSNADTDFAVRLTDVDADDNQLLIAEGIRRLKLRDNFATESPVNAGERYNITIEMTNELAYSFAAGHRIGLIVTSSNSPRFEINPNTGDNFFADAPTPIAVTNTLHLDGVSVLTLPLE
jgi:predicted acyl esterase